MAVRSETSACIPAQFSVTSQKSNSQKLWEKVHLQKKAVLTEPGCLADVTDYVTVMRWDPSFAHYDLLVDLLHLACFSHIFGGFVLLVRFI